MAFAQHLAHASAELADGSKVPAKLGGALLTDGTDQRTLRDRHTLVMLPILGGCSVVGLFWDPSFTTQVVLMLIGIATIGLGHGAMDHRVGEMVWRPRFGRSWVIVFAMFYLTLGAAGFALWIIAPAVALAAFLLYSAFHFGSDQFQENGFVHALARGTIPLLLPIAFRPQEVSEIFSTIASANFSLGQYALSMAVVAAIAVLFTMISAVRRGEYLQVSETGVLVAINFTLPPLLAFTCFFVFLHSIRHLIELAGWLEPRSLVRGFRRIARESLPLTLAALVAGAVAINFGRVDGIEPSVLQVVFIGLSCLTVPHMVVTHLGERRSTEGHS